MNKHQKKTLPHLGYTLCAYVIFKIVNARPYSTLICSTSLVKFPQINHSFLPSPLLMLNFLEITYCNNRFSKVTTTHKHAKYDVLISHCHQLKKQILPPLMVTKGIKGTIHNSFHQQTHWSLNPSNQIPLKNLAYIISNKRKKKKHRTHVDR